MDSEVPKASYEDLEEMLDRCFQEHFAMQREVKRYRVLLGLEVPDKRK